MFTHTPIPSTHVRGLLLFAGILALLAPATRAEPAPIPGQTQQTAAQVLQSSGNTTWSQFAGLRFKSEATTPHPNQAVFEDKLQALLKQPGLSGETLNAVHQLYTDYALMEASTPAKEAMFKAYYMALDLVQGKVEDVAFETLKPDGKNPLPPVEFLRQQQQEGMYYYTLDHQTILERLPQAASTPGIVYFLSLHAMHDAQAPFDDAGVLITWPQLAYTLEAIQRFKKHYPEFPVSVNRLDLMYTTALLGRFDNAPLFEGVLNDSNELPLRPGVREGLELYLKYCKGAQAYGSVKALYDQLKLNGFKYKAVMNATEALR